MPRPYGLLRAGFPYLKTLGMRRISNFPIDVAFGKEGRVYILLRADNSPLIRKWHIDDAEMLTDELEAIGSNGTDEGQYTWPVQLISDKDENLFLTDEWLNRITAYSVDGDCLFSWGEQGTDEGKLNRPAGIAFDPNEENVYVVDSLNHRIQKFTRKGKFISTWGEFGEDFSQFNMRWGIEVDEKGDVYVADWRNDRIQKFSSDGDFIWSLGNRGTGSGEFRRPTGIAVDKHGDIYVSDFDNNRIQLFNENKQYVMQFTGDASMSRSARNYMLLNAYPNRIREMSSLDIEKLMRGPKSVRVDDQFRMFVPDFRSYRVQVYQKEAIELTNRELSPEMRAVTLSVV